MSGTEAVDIKNPSSTNACGPASARLLARWQVGRRPILILGHGRSGTSWIGNIIAAARRVLYYFEPLHPSNLGGRDLSNWFRYARPGDTDAALASAYDPIFAGLNSPAKAWNRHSWHRWLPGYRVVVKDVAVLMAAEWLYDRYRPLMLFVVRHPCAVVLSELDQGTPPERSLEAIVRQADLVNDHLSGYVPDLAEVDGAVGSLAAVWAARHRVVANGLVRYPEWKVICYEALCADPRGQFKQLFEALGLRWSKAMSEYVERRSSVDLPGKYSGRRVSRQQIDKWKGQMDLADVQRIRQITTALNVPFYASDEAWTLAKYL